MDYMLMPLRRYADFQGRSRRKEYWMFALGIFIVYIGLAIIAGILGAFSMNTANGAAPGMSTGGWVAIGLFSIFVLAIFIPSLAVQVRRFHDQDKSGWFVLLSFIPYIGGIVVLVFMCLEGTQGPNRFGPDPKTTPQTLTDVFS
jgi:uncharacterized membrane protein YhaH (DUF805 family)